MQTIGGREPLHGDLGRFYDAIENPRKIRGELPILRDAELRSYMADVRERTLDVLDGGRHLRRRRGPAAAGRLRLRDAARPRAPAQRDDAAAAADGRRLRAAAAIEAEQPCSGTGRPRDEGPRWSPSTAATYEIGAPPAGFAYDNERPRHAVELAAFEIDRTPVTNAAYIAFMEETGAEPPLYWERDGRGLGRHRDGPPRRRSTRPIPSSTSPGTQADAFARWAGKRLPTEFEWEAARAAARRRRPGLGVDLLGLPRLPRLRGLPLPRVLRGLLRRRVQGPARQLLGDRTRGSPGPASATGTCRSAARSSPASAARGTLTIAIDVHLDADAAATMARDVRAGLCAYPKELAPKYFYDERGSRSSSRSPSCPSTTRPGPSARSSASARPRSSPPPACPGTLIELGSGSAAKTRHLLSAMRDAGSLDTYVPVDISEEITHRTAAEPGRRVPRAQRPRPRLRLRAAPGADPRRRPAGG